MRKLILLLFVAALFAPAGSAQQYDLVLRGGRAMDPETNLDAVRNVGITGGNIIRITPEPLVGRRTIDATGLVIAPGFIDLHQHAQDIASQRVKALDGVSTALELEIGAPDVAQFIAAKRGRSLIHYGTSASHVAARALVFGAPLPGGAILPQAGAATDQPASPAQIQAIRTRLGEELDAGGLAIGMGLAYTPGATRLEVIDIFRLAAQRRVPVYTHVRGSGPVEPGGSIESVSEVVAAAAISGAALHIVHLNSSCGREALDCLDMVAGARARGLDVTTESYPYTAGMTAINSAVFNPGWQKRLGISYESIMIPATGERLTEARFNQLHASNATQYVVVFGNSQAVLDQLIPNPLVMIASDGLEGHPRNAGTFSRVLREYVREKGTLTLMDALRKMTLMPAEMLERSTPAARHKGRLQEGADADIVVFDPLTITDHATYAQPMQPSRGVHFLIVGGTVLVDQGSILPDVFPGRAILGATKDTTANK